MSEFGLRPPSKGFTKAERAWIAELIAEIRSVKAVQGANMTVNNTESGQVVNANDCPLCEPCL